MLQKTPLNAWHRANGASMVDFGGWDMPVSYGPIGPEHLHTRQACGLFDISHMGQLWVRGAGAAEFLQRLTTNDVDALYNGRMQYSLLPNEEGGLHDDIIVTRVDEDDYYVVVNASNAYKDLAHLKARAAGTGLDIELWAGQALLALQGPQAQAQLQPWLSAGSLDSLKYYHLRADSINNVPVLVSRSGYTGEDGFEISVPGDQATAVWQALLEKGVAKPVGLGARNTLRMEMGYALYGHEIDEQSNAYEAGLGWVVKPAKGEFLGKAAIVAAKDSPKRRLVGFKLKDKGVARDGYPILNSKGMKVGHVTSGGPSPSLENACVGLAYVPVVLSDLGSVIHIDVRGRALEAEVVKLPLVPSRVKKN